jgi:hypothetical protein
VIHYKRPISFEIYSSASIFVLMCQYSCCYVPLTLQSIASIRFVLVASPATRTTIFRSDRCFSIALPQGTSLRCPIDDQCGKSCYALVSNGTDWYYLVPNLNSYKFNEINRCSWQLSTQFVSPMYVNAS